MKFIFFFWERDILYGRYFSWRNFEGSSFFLGDILTGHRYKRSPEPRWDSPQVDYPCMPPLILISDTILIIFELICVFYFIKFVVFTYGYTVDTRSTLSGRRCFWPSSPSRMPVSPCCTPRNCRSRRITWKSH